jgi:hypothetical protein
MSEIEENAKQDLLEVIDEITQSLSSVRELLKSVKEK